MTDERQSLLESGQMDLLSTDQMPAAIFASEEHPDAHQSSDESRNPTFTARRLFSQNPETYKLIVSLRAEGMPAARVARLLHVSRNTVAAIDLREGQTATVEHIKHGAARLYRSLAGLAAERLQEILLDARASLSPRDLAVVIGVLEDKAQLLSGGPTSRVEFDHGEPEHGKLLAYLQRLKAEYDAGTGFGEDGAGQTREALPVAAEVGPARPSGDGTPRESSAAGGGADPHADGRQAAVEERDGSGDGQHQAGPVAGPAEDAGKGSD